MAGKFRGDVGKLSKPKLSKSSKRAKGKKVVSLVKRSSKLRQESLLSRIAELTSGDSGGTGGVTSSSKSLKTLKSASTSRVQAKTPVGRAAIEVVGNGRKERVVPENEVPQHLQRTTAEAIGLKMLHQAVRNQSHNRLLPYQGRHDYEYRLRSVATAGVVQLFNSLAQARKASAAVEASDVKMTSDKMNEKKEVVSREAFLAALRQPRQLE